MNRRRFSVLLILVCTLLIALPSHSGASGGGVDISKSTSKNTATPGEKVTFGLGSRPSPCPILWDFGDGTTGEGWPVTHTYAKPGTYKVRASFACAPDATPVPVAPANINIVASDDKPPIAVLKTSLTSVVALQQSVHFDASGSSDPDGQIVSYAWDFGDGAKGTGVSLDHTYKQPGQFKTTLIVTDNGNVSDSAIVSINVAPPPGGMPTDTPAPTALAPTPVPRPVSQNSAPAPAPSAFLPGQPSLDFSGLPQPTFNSTFSLVHLGVWKPGQAIPDKLFSLPTTGEVRGLAESDAQWLTVSPTSFSATGDQQTDNQFTLHVANPKLLLPGQTSWAHINFLINGASYNLTVEVAITGVNPSQSDQVNALYAKVVQVLNDNKRGDAIVDNARYRNPSQLVQGLAVDYVLHGGYNGKMSADTFATHAAELLAGADFDNDLWIGFTDADRAEGAIGDGYITQ